MGAGTDQSISLAKAISKPRPDIYYMPNQYENDANFLAHYESTGPEIWKQTNGDLTHFLTGCGTGGTITGTATFLKEKNKNIKIIAIQAQKNHLLQGLRNFEESSMPDLFLRRQKIVDEWFTATNEESFGLVRALAIKERLLVGPSSGSVMASMLKTAEKLESRQSCGYICRRWYKIQEFIRPTRRFHRHGILRYPQECQESFKACLRTCVKATTKGFIFAVFSLRQPFFHIQSRPYNQTRQQ